MTNDPRSIAHWPPGNDFDGFRKEAADWLHELRESPDLETARKQILTLVNDRLFDTYSNESRMHDLDRVIVRDCARAWHGLLHPRSERLAGFSVLGAIRDASLDIPRTDLSPGFWAEMIHLVRGIQGRARHHDSDPLLGTDGLVGRAAAVMRSTELDGLAATMNERMSRFEHGLSDQARRRRADRAATIMSALGASEGDWKDWNWHIRNIASSATELGAIAAISEDEISRLLAAGRNGIPVSVTPYYASLFDDQGGDRDRSVRAQVIPPTSYIDAFLPDGDACGPSDFMLESDTSPTDLITRRYAAIAILKPWNSCPQICVYCQRNWEIAAPIKAGATSPGARIDAAVSWLSKHPGIHEVLITGGDPLMLPDTTLKAILDAVAANPNVERIRIGSRTPVTLPMRITPALATLLGSYRIPGVREVCLMTHVEHPYEVTDDFVAAVDRLRMNGVPVYNQLVYTFFVSRRFEAASLRRLLRRCGVDPYYTFYPKGKAETIDYRVPIARMLQEQKEEARLLPGLARTDEPVFNVPGLGKNYLNSWQHRDLVAIRPDGSRVYEFHPWEKKIASQKTWIGDDVPILDYLRRLALINEDPADYQSIWYYF